MNQPVKVSEKVYWIGVNDRETALFENLWPLDKGVAYNSYLINDEKVALIDTVKINKMDTYFEKIQEILGENKEVDYLIVNHMEPDHSGAIKEAMHYFPNIKIVGNQKTLEMLEAFYGITDNFYLVKDGDVLDLGEHKLRFYLTPMVHWPETMMSYDETDKILFSMDAFGGFGSLDGGVFDDEVNLEFYEDEIRRYFSNIVGKFSMMVQNALKKLQGLDISIVAPTHGPVWRENPQHIISLYDKWSRYEAEEGVVIVYGSMYGNTERMADFIARKLSEKGITNIRLYDASKTHVSYIISDMWRFKGVILGSCAYNSGLFPSMQTVINKIENSALKNRVLGIFGNYSWSGGGVVNLEAFADKMKWERVGESVEAKSSPKAEDFKKCVNIAEEMVKKLKA
ncbi:FprA family A-type flavoprotein [Irregularibacter muris]|uniref:FprA family A-type flavoprotein n=1 Tax=Irregularibacter muris TaxID=1796619 RepID=A0AAE3L336_9FIRM|nr:FprA family A-type flavoprotein [Irregularibacter muris]MCR1897573.1 FprA family A-type flavoprotein [Irregularibacter muris]